MAARDLILNNFWWKLLSLILAALTWLTIQTILRKDRMESAQSPVITTNARTFPDVPVTLLTSPYNTNLFRVRPSTVSVEVTGGVDDLNQLQLNEITAYVDMRAFDGQLQQDIQVQMPQKFRKGKVRPSMISVERLPPSQPNSPPPEPSP